MTAAIVFVLTTIFCSRSSSAFVLSNTNNERNLPADNAARATAVLGMIGGRGWDNHDYLSSLSGDDDDREKSQEEYKDFSERRAAFNARQEEILKTPEGEAFMKRRQEQQHQNLQREQQQSLVEDDKFPFRGFVEGSGGGTRMAQMMAQSKRMQGQRRGGNMIGGFRQELLSPLEEDEEDEI